MAARLSWSASLSNNRFLLSCANVKFYLEINRKRLGKSGHREHPAPSSHGRDALLSSLIKGRKHDGFGLQDAAGNQLLFPGLENIQSQALQFLCTQIGISFFQTFQQSCGRTGIKPEWIRLHIIQWITQILNLHQPA